MRSYRLRPSRRPRSPLAGVTEEPVVGRGEPNAALQSGFRDFKGLNPPSGRIELLSACHLARRLGHGAALFQKIGRRRRLVAARGPVLAGLGLRHSA